MKILQIGNINWSEKYQVINPKITWDFCMPDQVLEYISNYIETKSKFEVYDCLLITVANIGLEALDKLAQVVDNYRIIYADNIELSAELRTFLGIKCAWKLDCTNPTEVIRQISYYFFQKQSGGKLLPTDVSVSTNYLGSINYTGTNRLELNLDYTSSYQPIVSWNKNIYAADFRNTECWLEFTKDETCELQLVLEEVGFATSYQGGKRYIISNEDLNIPTIIPSGSQRSYLMATLYAKGKGKLTLGPLHMRWSRGPFGKFFPGGKRVSISSNREEFFYYFDPGNLKPPLCVYFGGYHPLEGFEGYYMMRSFHHPFILISDPRLEGGAFYLGNKEYEQKMQAVIAAYLKKLNFTKQQLILSGMSMGTFGALYYGAKLSPHAIILNKPLVNLGTMAANLQTKRPFVFGTALDLLVANSNSTTSSGVDQLNQRFWNCFNAGDFDHTTFAIAYMENDDYDGDAFKDIVQALIKQKSHAKVISQGFLGRHNDDFIENTKWFKRQYRRILNTDF